MGDGGGDARVVPDDRRFGTDLTVAFDENHLLLWTAVVLVPAIADETHRAAVLQYDQTARRKRQVQSRLSSYRQRTTQ